MSSFFSHPFVLAAFGAIVTVFLSGIMVPRITQEWQNRQQELNLKTSLVGDMSETVTRFIATIESYELRGTPSLASYEKTYHDWVVRSEVIGARIQAYYPGTSVARDWQRYVNRGVDGLFGFSEADPSDKTTWRGWLHQIRTILSAERNKAVDWKTLVNSQDTPPLTATATAWQGLEHQVLDQKSDVIQEVLNSRITNY